MGALADYNWKRNDTGPPVQAELGYQSTGPADLTGASVKFIMAVGQGTPTTGTAVIVDPTGGIVSYTPTAATTATAGAYNVEWQVTFPGGSKVTFPNTGYQTVTIEADLDNA